MYTYIIYVYIKNIYILTYQRESIKAFECLGQVVVYVGVEGVGVGVGAQKARAHAGAAEGRRALRHLQSLSRISQRLSRKKS